MRRKRARMGHVSSNSKKQILRLRYAPDDRLWLAASLVKDNRRSFAYHPQAEMRLGPRALRMTPCFCFVLSTSGHFSRNLQMRVSYS
jgi:hypothetical protein